MNAAVGTNAQLSLVVAISRKRNGNVLASEYIASVEVVVTPTMANPAICHKMPRSSNLNGTWLLDFVFIRFAASTHTMRSILKSTIDESIPKLHICKQMYQIW